MTVQYIPVEVPEWADVFEVMGFSDAGARREVLRIVGPVCGTWAGDNDLPLDLLPEGVFPEIWTNDGRAWICSLHQLDSPTRRGNGKTPRAAMLAAIALIPAAPKTREERLEVALRRITSELGTQPAGDGVMQRAYDAAIEVLAS